MATRKRDTVLRYSLEDGVSGGLKKITGLLSEFGSSLLKVTGIAAGATAALAAIGGALSFKDSLAAAANFEKSLDRIRAATGATDVELRRIGDSIEQAAQDSAKGVDETAAAFEALAREGFDTAAAIDTLPAALNFATAASLESAEAASLLADTLDQYGVAAADAAKTTDTLVAASLAGGTGVGDLTNALRAAAPVAAQLGLGIDQAAAALGLLARSGIEGSKAGAALRGILGELADPTSKFREELVKLGITSTDFGTVVEQLGARGKGAEAALNALGNRAGPALAAILRQGAPALREFVATLRDSEGAAANAAAVINDNLLTAFGQLQNSLLDLGRKFLEPLLAPLTDELQSAVAQIREFADSQAFKDLSEAFKTIFIGGVQSLKAFIAEFNFDEASERLSKFAANAKKSTEEIVADVRAIADAVRAVTNVLGGIVDAGKTAFNQSVVLTSGLAEGVARVAGIAVPALDDVAESLADVARNANEASGTSLASLISRFTGLKVEAADVDAVLSDVNGKAVTLTTSAAALEQEFAALPPAADAAASAVAGVGTAAQQTGEQAATASRSIVAIAEQLGELRNEITRQTAAGAADTVLSPLIAQADKLQQRLAAAKEAAAGASAAVQQGAAPATAALEGTSAAAQETASSLQQTGQAAQQAGAAAADGASQTAGAASELFGLINALSQKYKGISDGALQFFLDALKASTRGVTSLQAFGEAIERADKATVAALANQKKQAEAIGTTLQTFADTGVDAFGRVGLEASYTVDQLNAVITAAREGRSGFELLDQASLAGIIAQAEAARAKVQALADQALSAYDQLRALNRELQDQADRDAGNEEALAKRKFEEQVARIRELARIGGTQAQFEAAEAERRANEAYQRELARIRGLREEQRKSTDDYVANKERERAANDTVNGGTASAGGIQRPATPAPGPTTLSQPRPTTINIEVSGPVMGTLDAKAVENLARNLEPELNRIAALRR